MSNLVAIEWDAREARIAIGRPRSGGASVEQAFAISLETGDDEQATLPAQQIIEALKKHGVASRAETIVALGRSDVELRQLQMPPCPDDELPEMVRFQAMRQFTGVNENWPLDFFPLHRLEDDDAVHVLAAAINPTTLEPIRGMCSEANVSLRRIVLRPFAASSLMKRASSANQCRMLVDMLSDAADLTVLVGDDVVFSRTVRLPASNVASVRANAKSSEIRRTIPAARNQAGGRDVELITLCGDHSELGPLEEIVRSKLELAVDRLDPFAEVHLAGELSSQRPENAGRYAALLGALNAHGANVPRGIDFLNPRRRPKPKSNRNRYAFAGALAVVIVFVLSFLGWYELHRLGQKVAVLQEAFDQQEPQAKMMRERDANFKQISEHMEHRDIVWLDELRHISDKLPDADLAMISNMSMSPDPKGNGGKVTLKGFVDDSPTVEEMRRRLDDGERRMVDAGPVLTSRQYDQFRYGISEALYVRPKAESGTSTLKDATGDNDAATDPASSDTPPSADESTADESTGDKAVGDQPAGDGSTADKKSADADDPDEKGAADEKTVAEESADGQPADDKPADDKPADEPTDNKPAESPAEDKPAVVDPNQSDEAKSEKPESAPAVKPAGEKSNDDLTQEANNDSPLKTASNAVEGSVQ